MDTTVAAELVFIPAPGVGHIISIIEMAKVLVNRDPRLSITVLLINPPHSVLALTTYIDSLAKNTIQRIRFIQVPQDQKSPKLDPKAFFASYDKFINSHCKHVRKIVADMIKENGSRMLVGLVVDAACTGMIDVANELDVSTYVFFPSTCGYLGFISYMETLWVNKIGVVEASESEGEIVVPSFVNPVPIKVVHAVSQVGEEMDAFVYFFRRLKRAKGIMVNTFLELETHAINWFSGTDFPPVYVYPVGPVLNLDGVAGKAGDRDVISWLDEQAPSSVVFLCFGSMGSFNEVQVKEIARGLEQSGHRFVWSLRRPRIEQSSEGDVDYYDGVLPDGFLERTSGTGKVIGWAPQVSLLAHEAVGGFVSHCGWNSILESLWFGVPTATWPMYSEQQLNAFEMVVELGLAVELKMDYKIDAFNPDAITVIVTAEEIESGIRRVMEDNKVRAKVKEMSRLSRATVVEGGSSYASVDYLVHEMMSNIM